MTKEGFYLKFGRVFFFFLLQKWDFHITGFLFVWGFFWILNSYGGKREEDTAVRKVVFSFLSPSLELHQKLQI